MRNLYRQFCKGLKEARTFEDSPDGCNYPFLLGFSKKDNAVQQEFHLKNSEVWLQKKSQLQ